MQNWQNINIRYVTFYNHIHIRKFDNYDIDELYLFRFF